MKKIVYNLLLFTLLATFAVACVEDDGDPVVNTENPFELTAVSKVTLKLKALSSNELDCLSMNYPITVATYVEGFVIDETITLNNAAELLNFINNLAEGDTYAIKYPFTITGNGEVINIIGNDAFLETIIAESDACCITTNTAFSQLYNAVNAPEQTAMDTSIHEYTFSVNEPGKICSIGYKGQTNEMAYLIEILDDQDAVVYTGTHTFNSTQIEYVSITQIEIAANKDYTIRRTVAGTDPGLTGVGPVKSGTSVLPASSGPVTIHEANFYNEGGTGVTSGSLPMIDFVFKPQPQ